MRKKPQPQVEPLPLLSSKPDGSGNRIQQIQTSYFENLKISHIAEQALKKYNYYFYNSEKNGIQKFLKI